MGKTEQQSITVGLPILTFSVLFVSTFSFLYPKAAAIMIFDRHEVERGEIWRLFSAHFVHFTSMHLAYNLLVFGIVGWILEKKNFLHFFLLYALMAFIISTSLFILKPSMSTYGGLSGIATGFCWYCALIHAGKKGPWQYLCKWILVLLPIKIVLETYRNDSLFPYWEQQQFVTMPTSHAAGIVAALLFYILVQNNKGVLNVRRYFH